MTQKGKLPPWDMFPKLDVLRVTTFHPNPHSPGKQLWLAVVSLSFSVFAIQIFTRTLNVYRRD